MVPGTRRAYFDDGSPLGSAENSECRIDSIAQSWSVLSGSGEAPHARMAMDAVDRILVRREVRWSNCWIRRSTTPNPIPATSKGT